MFSELKSEIVSEFHRTARYYPSSSVHVCGGVFAQESGNTPSIPCFIHRVRPTSYNPQEVKGGTFTSPWPLTTVINSPQTLSENRF